MASLARRTNSGSDAMYAMSGRTRMTKSRLFSHLFSFVREALKTFSMAVNGFPATHVLDSIDL
ncbi:hypothetical protein D3C87_2074830 [compost metagenome]